MEPQLLSARLLERAGSLCSLVLEMSRPLGSQMMTQVWDTAQCPPREAAPAQLWAWQSGWRGWAGPGCVLLGRAVDGGDGAVGSLAGSWCGSGGVFWHRLHRSGRLEEVRGSNPGTCGQHGAMGPRTCICRARGTRWWGWGGPATGAHVPGMLRKVREDDAGSSWEGRVWAVLCKEGPLQTPPVSVLT